MCTIEQKPLQIHPSMCKQQQEDLQIFLDAVDDFASIALSLSNNSAQGYANFISARDRIRTLITETGQKYRLVTE